MNVLLKVIGYDGEVGNFITGVHCPQGTGHEASRLILREFEGIRAERWQPVGSCQPSLVTSCLYTDDGMRITAASDGELNTQDKEGMSIHYNLQDVGRTFLAENGGCVYIDLDHVELCLPEVCSAFDHVACWHAMLRLLRNALDAANRHQPPGRKIHVLLNNSDGEGHSYGTHTNFLITERCRQNIFERKMQYLLYLTSYQVSSILFTGQGKVGSENGAPAVTFQLSQRADFMEQLVASQTTFCRPIVNSRDEAHCGSLTHYFQRFHKPDMARLHVIFYDSTLCHVSSLLKVGVMQIILAMIEAGYIDNRLILDDPLQALLDWSHDPTLQAKARMWSGGSMTAVELQLLFLEAAMRFVEDGRCEGIVPRASEIIDLWADTLGLLRQRDLHALSRRVDWALKLSAICRVLEDQPHLDWMHPAIKQIDHVYSSLDLRDGLYWAFENDNAVERVVSDAEIERFLINPPEDTRAWTRAMLLRRAGSSRIESVDWDRIRFTDPRARTFFARTQPNGRTVELANPLGFTRAVMHDVFESAESLDAILDVLDLNTTTHKGKRGKDYGNS